VTSQFLSVIALRNGKITSSIMKLSYQHTKTFFCLIYTMHCTPRYVYPNTSLKSNPALYCSIGKWLNNEHTDVKSQYLLRLFAIINPTFKRKICRFCTIKTMVEARMIGIWKCYHELACLVDNL
jgi:hypothetical protein